VLKDLTPDDYKVYRNAPASVDDSKLIVKRLAQFHAASIYLNDSVSKLKVLLLSIN
jgi:hypothetical protein